MPRPPTPSKAVTFFLAAVLVAAFYAACIRFWPWP